MTTIDITANPTSGGARRAKDAYSAVPGKQVPPAVGRARVNMKAVAAATVPMIAPEAAIPSVERALNPSDVDSHATLAQLRDLVVGPSQRLNEARLEELIRLFDEREADIRGALREIERSGEELKITIDQNNVRTLNAFKAEFMAAANVMSDDMKKAIGNLREEIAAVRKESQSLVQALGDATERGMLEVQQRFEDTTTTKLAKMKAEMDLLQDSLNQRMINCQREAQLAISRIFNVTADDLARNASTNG